MTFRLLLVLSLSFSSVTECKSDIIYAGLMAEGVSPEAVAPLMNEHGLFSRASSLAEKTLFQKKNEFAFKLIDSRETSNLALSTSFGAQALAIVIRGDHHSYFSYVHPDTGKNVFKHFYIIPMTGLVYRFNKDGNVIQKSYPVLARSVHLLESAQFNPEHLFMAYQSGLKQLSQDLIQAPPNQRMAQLISAGKNRFRIPLGKKDGILEGIIVSADSGELIVDEVQDNQSFLSLRKGKASKGTRIMLSVDNIDLPTAIFSMYPMTNETLRSIYNRPEEKLQITQWATEVFNRYTNYRVLPPELKDGFSLVPLIQSSITGPISAAGMAHEVIQSAHGGNQNSILFAPVSADKEFHIKLSGLDSTDITDKFSGLKRTGTRLILVKLWSAIRHESKDYGGTALAQIKILKNQKIDPGAIITDLTYEAVETAVKTYQKDI